MKLGLWLLTMCEPLLAKILLSLGFSVVTITGIDAGLSALKTAAIASFNDMPAAALNFMLYLWMGKAIGVIFGACTTKLLLWSIQNATSILGKNSS